MTTLPTIKVAPITDAELEAIRSLPGALSRLEALCARIEAALRAQIEEALSEPAIPRTGGERTRSEIAPKAVATPEPETVDAPAAITIDDLRAACVAHAAKFGCGNAGTIARLQTFEVNGVKVSKVSDVPEEMRAAFLVHMCEKE